MIIKLRPEDFKGGRLPIDGVVIVMFYAGWCPFCMAFKPVFEDFSAKTGLLFAEVDLSDYENRLWETFDVKVVPTVIAFKNGSVAIRKDGKLLRGLKRSHLEEILQEIK